MRGLTGISGQPTAVAHLTRALSQGRVHHAYVFAGPAGVGKRTTALALAMALNCSTAPSVGCGSCSACARILAGGHPDVLTITPQGAGHVISVETIRELLPRLGTSPHEGGGRVVILHDAHRLGIEAANAFLKTLEEPGAGNYFVLCTTAPSQLPVTVRSRSQVVRFAPLPAAALQAILAVAGHPAASAQRAIAGAKGSARRALELVTQEGGLAGNAWLDKLRAAAASGRMTDIAEVALTLSKDKEEIQPALDRLASHFRDAAVEAAANGDQDCLPHAARAVRRARLVLDTQEALRGFAHGQLALEDLLLSLSEV